MKRNSKRNFVILISLLSIFLLNQHLYAVDYKLNSPDTRIGLKVTIDSSITYSVEFNNNVLLSPSVISLTLQNGIILGKDPKVKEVIRRVINEKIYPVVPQKNKEIDNNCTELKIQFKSNFNLIFRV